MTKWALYRAQDIDGQGVFGHGWMRCRGEGGAGYLSHLPSVLLHGKREYRVDVKGEEHGTLVSRRYNQKITK